MIANWRLAVSTTSKYLDNLEALDTPASGKADRWQWITKTRRDD